MTDIEHGVELWCDIAHQLNDIIQRTGPIDINNKRIWDSWLHLRTDLDWANILIAFKKFNDDHSNLVDLNQYRVWDETATLFDKYYGVVQGDGPGRSCLDYKRGRVSTKHKAWHMIMILREVHNKACGIAIENR
jgi:hypothetical protein